MPPSTTDPRARLLARRHELLQELEEAWDAERSAVEADASGVHDSKDEADRSAAAGRRHAEASRDAAELRAVQEALRRLDAGTYGRCVEYLAFRHLRWWPLCRRWGGLRQQLCHDLP